jgi:hypothetical protein
MHGGGGGKGIPAVVGGETVIVAFVRTLFVDEGFADDSDAGG